jgi:hypothetical protein
MGKSCCIQSENFYFFAKEFLMPTKAKQQKSCHEDICK